MDSANHATQYFERATNRLDSVSDERKRTFHSRSAPLCIQFYAFNYGTTAAVIATTDHFQRLFAALGLSSLDIIEVVRTVNGPDGLGTLIHFRSWDVFTWFLDIDHVQLCGQKLWLRYPTALKKDAFSDKYSTNVNRLTEARFQANYECYIDYRPPGTTENDLKSESVSTKVFIWGDTHEAVPQLWRGLGEGRAVIQASCGDSHMAFLTEMGQVITSGECLQGQVGNGPSSETIKSFLVKMPGNVAVRQIACGNTYTLALSETNNVFYWGTCKFNVPTGDYNIPKPNILFKCNVPTLWESIKQTSILQIASGAAHIVMLRNDGVVLSVGAPESGRLGRTGLATIPLPVLGLDGIKVSKITCGYANSVAFAQGHVYVWGRNDLNQCGIPFTPTVQIPTELKDVYAYGVLDIASGYEMSYAVTEKGAFKWGGGLGVTSVDFQGGPVKITQFAVGKRHTLARGVNGEVYAWGTSHLGQCGHGDQFTYPLPTRVRGLPKNMSGVAACGYSSVAFSGTLRSPLSEDFEKCLDNPKAFPDMAFQVGSTLIYAHRAMIVARCHELKILHLLLPEGGAGATADSSFNTIPLNGTLLKRTQWPDGLIPNQAAPINDQSVHPSSATDDKQPNSEVIIVPYETTLSGLPVTEPCLRSILRYIYTDSLSDEMFIDTAQSRALAKDFGLLRYEEILSPGEKFMLMPSTYIYDIGCLVKTPSEEDPSLASVQAKAQFQQTKHMEALVGAFADLSLTVSESGTVIPAHRFVLCARSNFFTTQLEGGMLEAVSRAVTLQTDDSTCRWLLRFIYSDRPCTSDINITVELLKVAAMIDLERLVYLCSRAIEKELDLETTAYMYHLTSEHSIAVLRDICWSLLKDNWKDVKNTSYWKDNLTEEERLAWTHKAFIS